MGMMDDNPLAGLMNEAEKQMGAEMYAAQVDGLRLNQKLTEANHNAQIEYMKMRLSISAVAGICVLVAVLPFWLLGIVYCVKAVFLSG